ELALSYASTLAESQIVDPAYSGDPVSPKKPLIYAFAFMLGLVFPAGLIYGRNKLNSRVSSKAEIESAVSAPIISELMFNQNKSEIVVNENGTYVIGEQFRS